jgi:hypothetical protein
MMQAYSSNLMQRFLRSIFIVLFLIPIVGMSLVWFFMIGPHSNEPGASFNTGNNAIWLEHTWVEDFHTSADLNLLGRTLVEHDITTIYLHSGPFDEDGTISPTRYAEAENFLTFMHEQFSQLEWQAWLGQIRSEIDLDDEQVRGEAVESARILVDEIGFDGIHYDIEPIRSGDDGFLNLLKETRVTLPEVTLSIATDEWQPDKLSQWVGKLLGIEIVSYWSTKDMENALPYIDQLVVMGYDTSLSDASWYQWFLEQQVIYVTNIAKNSPVEVYVGIPAYATTEATESSHSEAENVENGLLGVTRGLNNHRSNKDNFGGVAIYLYGEVEDEEWETMETLW